MSEIYAQTRVTTITTIRRRHRLPQNSVPKVMVGQTVKATENLAVAEVARDHRIIDLAEALDLRPDRVDAYLVKREGDMIDEGDVLALRRKFLRRRRVYSPLTGQVVRIDNGQMLLEGQRTRIEVESSVPGRVIEVEPQEYVIIETTGAAIQVAWGYGNLTWGTLKVLDTLPLPDTDAERFTIDHRGAILAIGSPLTAAFLKGAIAIRVNGLIASSMHASLMPMLEGVEFPIALTQGFGQMPMSERILSLLNTYNGREIAVDMGRSGDWRERRPEIIIPLASQQSKPTPDETTAGTPIAKGQKVRVLQVPYLGEIGTVTAVSDSPQQIESGLWAPGATIEMTSGESAFVPFANLERLG